MPNHVRNVLKFSNLTKDDVAFVLNRFGYPMEDKGIFPLNVIFDFNGVVPEPKTKDECPEDCLVNKDSHVEEDKDRPWFDWYTWHNKYWGTKWGAYDGYTKIGKTTVTFVFSTAWSAPFEVYEQLADKWPGLKWEVKYADEAIGDNCGYIQHLPFRAVDIYDEPTSNPEAFARRIWRNY